MRMTSGWVAGGVGLRYVGLRTSGCARDEGDLIREGKELEGG